jgi:hypothetical protein
VHLWIVKPRWSRAQGNLRAGAWHIRKLIICPEWPCLVCSQVVAVALQPSTSELCLSTAQAGV